VLSSSDLSGWHSLVTSKTLAKAAKDCGVQRITAVVSDGAFPILGVQCSRGDRIGVLFPSGDAGASSGGNTTWASGGPLLTGGSSGVSTVLRLEAASSANTGAAEGLNGLATVRSGRSSSLVAFWTSDPGSGWTQSRRLVIPAGWTVLATSTGGGSTGNGIAVLLDSGLHRRILSVSGPGSSWVTSPAAPSGTEAVVTVGSDLEAFAVDNSRLTIWTLGSAARWSRVQASNVPVPYGSSA
jgi:hypothetical protein